MHVNELKVSHIVFTNGKIYQTICCLSHLSLIERSKLRRALNIDVNQMNMGERSYICEIVGCNALLVASNIFRGVKY